MTKQESFPVYRKIIIQDIPYKEDYNINERIQWFARSFGLFGIRDRDKSCFRVFLELLKANLKNEMMTSDELSEQLSLSRASVVHHLNNLIDRGIVISIKSKYKINANSLEGLIDKIWKDSEEIFESLKEIAIQLDKELKI